MIEILRKAASSWIAKLLLGLLVASFAAWGVGDMLRGVGGSSVAQVGGETISVTDFRRAFGNRTQALQSRGIDLATARALGVDRIVLGELVTDAALWEEAQEVGVDAPDEAVIETLRELRYLQNAGGAFSPSLYERWLSSQGLRKRDFEADLRRGLARDLLADSIGAGGGLAREAIEAIWMRRNERRDLEFIRLDINRAPAPDDPDEATLRAYHQEQAARFTSPAYREIAYVWVRAADRADLDSVDESEARELYDERSADYVKPERRNLEQILFPDEEAAKAAALRVQDGDSFVAVAADAGYAPDDIALGYVAREEIESFDPALAEAAFGEQAEGVVGPVESVGGWALINIAGVSPGEETAFEKVRDDLLAEIAAERAVIELPAVANAVEDLRASGLSLVEVAERENVAGGSVTIDRGGLTPEGAPAEGLPGADDVLQRAFEMEIGDEMDLVETRSGEFYAIEVLGETPPSLKPFEDIAADVREAWIQDQRAETLADIAETLRERAAAGEAMADLAGEYNVDVERAEGLTRGASSSALPPELLEQIFALEADDAPGAAFATPTNGGKTRIVARVAAVAPADPANGADEIDAMHAESVRQVSEDILQLYAGAAMAEHGVELNIEAIDRALAAGAGGS